jgi:hypothetical protein
METGLEWEAQESSVSTRGDIIRWWEARRYHFNGFVLAVGFASWLLVMIAGLRPSSPERILKNRLGCFSAPSFMLRWRMFATRSDGLWTRSCTTDAHGRGSTSRD